jgi:hypothetical protein
LSGSALVIGAVSGGIVTTYSPSTGHLISYSLATNARVGQPVSLPAAAATFSVGQILGRLVLLYDFSGATSVFSLVDGSLRAVAGLSESHSDFLLTDGSVLTSSDSKSWFRINAAGTKTLVFSSTNGGSPLISGELVSFRVRVGDSARYCLVDMSTSTTSCQAWLGTLGKWDWDKAARLTPSGLLATIHLNGWHARWYPIKAGKLTVGKKLSLPMTGQRYAYPGSIEKTTPVIATYNASSAKLMKISATGKITQRKLAWSTETTLPSHLAITPTTVLGAQSDAFGRNLTWRRTLGAKLGKQVQLRKTDVDLSASAGRWTVAVNPTSPTASSYIALYDRGHLAKKLPIYSGASTLSGPRLLWQEWYSGSESNPDSGSIDPAKVYSPSGKLLATLKPSAQIFGDLALEQTTTTAYTVRNYLDASQPTYSIPLPDPGADLYYNVRIWGDWVSADAISSSTDDSPLVYNYRTGKTITSPKAGPLIGLGDGFAVITDTSYRAWIWNFNTGAVRAIPAASDVIAIDGNKVAYTSTSKLVVTTVAGAGKSAPRLLGVDAPNTFTKSWKFSADLTKPVKAGALEIRDAAGHLVRSLKVKASADGSIRGLVWDRRNTAGAKVAAGIYTYRLTNLATDGTGTVRTVSGATGQLGTVVVS